VTGRPTTIKLAKAPHIRAVDIEELCRQQPDIDIISPICRWLQSNRVEAGTSHSLRARCQFPRERIPEAFAFLDLWQTMRLSIPRYSQWCEEEYVTITCKPCRGNLPSKFSPIFVLTNPTAEGIHSKPTPSLHFRPILICLCTRIETCTDPTDLPGT
jgi:hypothetical protein